MLTKTKVNRRLKQKTNSVLAEAIFIAKKNNLKEIASALACPTKRQVKINLGKLNKAKSEVVIVPGKILSSGEITKKMKVYALGCSAVALEKLKKAGCEYKPIIEVLRKDNKLKGEILR